MLMNRSGNTSGNAGLLHAVGVMLSALLPYTVPYTTCYCLVIPVQWGRRAPPADAVVRKELFGYFRNKTTEKHVSAVAFGQTPQPRKVTPASNYYTRMIR